jgi:hypothetical protein
MFREKMLASSQGPSVAPMTRGAHETAGGSTAKRPARPGLSPAPRNYLPGLRRVEIDVDVYFKDAFFGQTY